MSEQVQDQQPKTFDLTVHKRDPKTGEVKSANPYILQVRDGVKIFTRNGKKYFENGELIPGQEEPQTLVKPIQQQTTRKE